jgi:signal transduction histidine kinase
MSEPAQDGQDGQDGRVFGWVPLLVRRARPDGGAPAALRADPACTVAYLWDVPGVRCLTPLADGERINGVIMIGDLDDGPETEIPEYLLGQTRDCLTLLLREHRLDAVLRDQRARSNRLDDRLARVEAELAGVREAERRRLAGWVLAGSNHTLLEVTRRWQECASAVRDDPAGALGALRDLRAALNDLIDDFRLVVRAVRPLTLRSRGTVAALRELVAHLPRGVRLAGDLGRRVGWEVESGLYHAAATALTLMSVNAGGELWVRFTRSEGRLTVRVSDPSPRSEGEVRAGLAEDARRLAALGGGLRYEVGADGAGAVELWLPARFPGVVDPLDMG